MVHPDDHPASPPPADVVVQRLAGEASQVDDPLQLNTSLALLHRRRQAQRSLDLAILEGQRRFRLGARACPLILCGRRCDELQGRNVERTADRDALEVDAAFHLSVKGEIVADDQIRGFDSSLHPSAFQKQAAADFQTRQVDVAIAVADVGGSAVRLHRQKAVDARALEKQGFGVVAGIVQPRIVQPKVSVNLRAAQFHPAIDAAAVIDAKIAPDVREAQIERVRPGSLGILQPVLRRRDAGGSTADRAPEDAAGKADAAVHPQSRRADPENPLDRGRRDLVHIDLPVQLGAGEIDRRHRVFARRVGGEGAAYQAEAAEPRLAPRKADFEPTVMILPLIRPGSELAIAERQRADRPSGGADGRIEIQPTLDFGALD